MNEYDSDHAGQILSRAGYCPADSPEQADLIIVNTCSVRAKAEQKAYSLLGRMARLKRKTPDVILGVMGCIAQQKGLELFSRFPELDLVLGTREIDRLKDFIDRIVCHGEKINAVDLSAEPNINLDRDGYFRGRVKGFITIMVGCNNFCSYCIVPYVRGREVSRNPEKIVGEAENLVSQGIKEITLLGQNVNSYCSAEEGGLNFPRLLKRLSKIEDLCRIRFTTSHPKDLSEELVNCFRETENLCPHIHLPFQSGSDRILKLMNRGYDAAHYSRLIDRLKRARPDISVTSDVIVGFPGETERDFQMTIDIIRKIEFDNLFSFKYSDRKGTCAEKLNQKVSEDEKSRRLDMLQGIQKDITLRKNNSIKGKNEIILVESPGKRHGQYSGRTGTNKIVNFDSNINSTGRLVNVKIERVMANSLYGKLIESADDGN